MPVKSGLDVARALGGRCHVVFVTAYDEYAVAAFDEGAVDYVLKPPDARAHGEGGRAAQGAARGGAARPRRRCSRGWPRARPAARCKWIRASLGASMKLIAVDDVLYFQAEDKYTKVVTADGDALIRKPIKELYDELDPEAFWQIHRGTIVNLRAIARVDRDWRDEPVIVLKPAAARSSPSAARSRTASRRCEALAPVAGSAGLGDDSTVKLVVLPGTAP